MIRKSEAVFRRDKRFAFARRSCSNNEPKRDDESSSSRRASDARSRVQIISMKANSNEAGNQQQRTGRNQTIRERHSGPIKRAERCTAPNAARVQKSTAIIQRRRSAVRPIWTGRRDTKFGEAVKVRNSSLPLVARFVTPLNCHQDNR